MKNTEIRTLPRMLSLVGSMVAVAGWCISGGLAAAAEIEFKPSLTISEEYNDNIFETVSNKRGEFITRVLPGFSSRYQAALWNWDVGYTFDFRNYARSSRGNEYNHDAAVRGGIVLVKDFMFLDVSESYHRVTTDVSRTAATESSLFLNQTDQNTAVISPYMLWRLGDNNTLKTGYRYTEVRYMGNGVETFEHGGTADFSHEFSPKFSLSTGYGFTYLESQPTRYTKHDLYGGLRYEYADRSFVFARAGNSWQQFRHDGNKDYVFWNAGITHDAGFAVATIETKVQTSIDPLSATTKETSYSGRIEKTLPRGMLGFSTSYSKFDNTQTTSTNQRRLTLNGTGRVELWEGLNANLAVTADRYFDATVSGFPYHLNAVTGLSYAFIRDLTLSLNYNFDTQRKGFASSSGAIVTNRVIVEVRKVF